MTILELTLIIGLLNVIGAREWHVNFVRDTCFSRVLVHFELKDRHVTWLLRVTIDLIALVDAITFLPCSLLTYAGGVDELFTINLESKKTLRDAKTKCHS